MDAPQIVPGLWSVAGLVLTTGCVAPVAPCPSGSDSACDGLGPGAGLGKGDDESEHRERVSVERRLYGESFEVIGPPANVADAIADLDALGATHLGGAILALVDEGVGEDEGRVKLRPRPGEPTVVASCIRTHFARGGTQGAAAAAADYEIQGDGSVAILEPGIPVPPADLRVYFHRACLADGPPAECAPPFVYLAHELLHVAAALRGTLLHHIPDPRDHEDQHPTMEESRAIGIGAYAGAPLTENGLRDELGLPRRDTHARFCPASP